MGLGQSVNVVFAPIAQAVEDFARSNSLRVEKCARGNSGWELVRSHPSGGDIRLLLLYNSELGLGVGSVWQFSCQEMALVYTHFRDMQPCAIWSDAVLPRLQNELDAIDRVKFGFWTHMSPLSAD
jgi:hypothetical protein